MNPCVVCNTPTQFICGGQCKKTAYCGRKCQQHDWSNHVQICKVVTKTNKKTMFTPLQTKEKPEEIIMNDIMFRMKSVATEQHIKTDAMNDILTGVMATQYNQYIRVQKTNQILKDGIGKLLSSQGIKSNVQEAIKTVFSEAETKYVSMIGKMFNDTKGNHPMLHVHEIDGVLKDFQQVDLLVTAALDKRDLTQVVKEYENLDGEIEVEMIERFVDEYLEKLPKEIEPKFASRRLLEFLKQSAEKGTFIFQFDDTTNIGVGVGRRKKKETGSSGVLLSEDDQDSDFEPTSEEEEEFDEEPTIDDEKTLLDNLIEDFNIVRQGEMEILFSSGKKGEYFFNREEGGLVSIEGLQIVEERIFERYGSDNDTRARRILRYFTRHLYNRTLSDGISVVFGSVCALYSIIGLMHLANYPVQQTQKEIDIINRGLEEMGKRIQEQEGLSKDIYSLLQDVKYTVDQAKEIVSKDDALMKDSLQEMFLQLYKASKGSDPDTRKFIAVSLTNNLIQRMSGPTADVGDKMLAKTFTDLKQWMESGNANEIIERADSLIGTYTRLIASTSISSLPRADQFEIFRSCAKVGNLMNEVFAKMSSLLGKMDERMIRLNETIIEQNMIRTDVQASWQSNYIQLPIVDMDPASLLRAYIAEKYAGRSGVQSIVLRGFLDMNANYVIPTVRVIDQFVKSDEFQRAARSIGDLGAVISTNWNGILITSGCLLVMNHHLLQLLWKVLHLISSYPTSFFCRKYAQLAFYVRGNGLFDNDISEMLPEEVVRTLEEKIKQFEQEGKTEFAKFSTDILTELYFWRTLCHTSSSYSGAWYALAKHGSLIGIGMVLTGIMTQMSSTIQSIAGYMPGAILSIIRPASRVIGQYVNPTDVIKTCLNMFGPTHTFVVLTMIIGFIIRRFRSEYSRRTGVEFHVMLLDKAIRKLPFINYEPDGGRRITRQLARNQRPGLTWRSAVTVSNFVVNYIEWFMIVTVLLARITLIGKKQ